MVTTAILIALGIVMTAVSYASKWEVLCIARN